MNETINTTRDRADRIHNLFVNCDIIEAYHSFIDYISEALVIHDKGKIFDVNKTAENILGYPKEQLIDKDLSFLVEDQFDKELVEKSIKSNHIVSYTISYVTKSKAFKTLQIRSFPTRGLAKPMRIALLSDITEEVETKQCLVNSTKELRKTQFFAAKNEKKFNTIFSLSYNAYLIHKNGIVLEVNKKFTELYGYTKEEAAGMDVKQFQVHLDNRAQKRIKFNIDNKLPGTYIDKQRRKDGSIFDAEVSAITETINNEEIRLVTIRDITNIIETQRELADKNNELERRNHDLEMLREQVISSNYNFYKYIQSNQVDLKSEDLQDIITQGEWHYNPHTEQFFWNNDIKNTSSGGEGSYCSYSHFIDRINPEDRIDFEQALQHSLSTYDIFKVEFRIINALGEERYIVAQGILKEHNDAKVLIGTSVDITYRKKVEDRLKQQRDHFLKLNEELIISRKKAEDSEKLKTAFFSNMSHEIRTPMNGILGFSNLLMEKDLQEEERVEYAKIIADSGKRLLNIVNDILDISKLESDTVKIVKGETNINEVINTLHRLYSENEKVKENQILLSVHTPLPDIDSVILTDYNRLNQILTNLLSNAFKFTEKGKITFGYRLTDRYVRFFVEDSGIGIPEDMKDVIFEPFRQVEGNLVRAHGGTGLGLSISKKLTNLLGGEMKLESDEGRGTRFIFTLPYTPIRKNDDRILKTPVAQKTLKENIKEITLLIAEDDDVNFIFYNSFLGKRMNVIRAKNGKEAIAIVSEKIHIDVILMDVKMPEMSGYEAMREIRRINHEIPIIVQTAYAMNEDRQKAFDHGADDYISKPINRKDLIAKIKALCVCE